MPLCHGLRQSHQIGSESSWEGLLTARLDVRLTLPSLNKRRPYLLRQLRHVDRLDLSEGGQLLQSLLGLLLDGDDEGVLHVAVLRQVHGWGEREA